MSEGLYIHIKSKEKNYSIIIDAGLIKVMDSVFSVSDCSSIYIISDLNVGPLYFDSVSLNIKKKYPNIKIDSFQFQAGEENKNLQTVEKVLKDMASRNFDRKGLVINLGGGVVTDMGGFVASIYQRGVKFINISTSVLGMVDASVGGKLGVDLEDWKNYAGIFNHPEAVIIDVDALETLPVEHWRSGWAEIIKHGLIADSEYFQNSVSREDLRKFSQDELIEIIKRSNEIKAKVVEEDEKEGGIRKILNFGHTVGHAIESLSFKTDRPLSHGEAVAIGMIAEAKISELLGKISKGEFVKIEKGIKRVGLPIRYTEFSFDEILPKMQGDKKNFAGSIKWTLLEGIGKCSWDNDVDIEIVRDVIDYIIS